MIPASNPEKDMLQNLLKSGKSITLAVPDDLDPRDINSYIKHTCSLMSKAEISHDKLRAVLGRLLVLARKNKEVWGKAGVDTYEEFIQDIVSKYKISRSTLFEIRKYMTAFPDLAVADYGTIGSQKLLLLSRFTQQSDGGSTKLLKAATEKSYDDLKAWVEEKGYLGADEATGGSLTLKGSLADIKKLKKFLGRDDIKAHAGEDPLGIVLAMTMEVEAEWSEQGAAALKEQAAAAKAPAA
jgi:hypothetical protein